MPVLTTSSSDGVMIPIHTLSAGSPAKPPILFVHATGFHGRAYQAIATHLAKRTGSTILAPDLRGHGDSPSPVGGRYSWDAFAQDLSSVVDAIAERDLVAFGHSMGGATLLRVEQQRPGTFSHLTLFEPIVFPPQFRTSDDDSPLVEASRRRRNSFPSFADAIDRFGSKPPLDALDQRCLRDYVQHGFEPTSAGDVKLKLPGTEEAEVFRMSLKLDTWDHLPTVQSETLILYGYTDGPSAASAAPLIADRLPNGRGDQHVDLGHFGPLQDPERIADQLMLG